MTRFIGATAPVITVTKCHDLEEGIIWYDLYLDGKFQGRFQFSDIMKKIQEVLYDV